MTDSETEHKSTVTFRHEYSTMKVVKGVRDSLKENIIDGEKGLYISLLTKNGDDFYRARIKQTDDDSFDMEEKKGEKETKSVITMDELKKLVSKNKYMKFAEDYLSTRKKVKPEKAGGGAKKRPSKKSSMKGSKKAKKSKKSKKVTRKY